MEGEKKGGVDKNGKRQMRMGGGVQIKTVQRGDKERGEAEDGAWALQHLPTH